MRGKGLLCSLFRSDAGITPAYAGKSRWYAPRVAHAPDHPRVCGEKPENPNSACEGAGSPPRMRGKGEQVVAAINTARITPAYAGKRWEVPTTHEEIEDHPRICGEKTVQKNGPTKWAGSPPHMRGKVFGQLLKAVPAGITPAYAGKSSGPTSKSGTNGDHPRVCGEKRLPLFALGLLRGSPPRMRGKD